MFEFLKTFLMMSLLATLGFWIRLRPLKINSALGVDHWYWLLCAEDVKKRRKLPPKLPYFMLEIEEQWYPPLFAGLLALLPMKWLKDHGGKISQFIDLFHGWLIFSAVFWVSDNLNIAFLSGLSYFIAWFPMTCNTQLQPRGLANLLLTLAMAGLWFYIDTGNLAILGGVLILSVLLLFLHKMTVQIWTLYLFGFGVWLWDLKILLLLPTSLLLAIIISKGFYIKIIKAHWDIVSFWHENIHFLGSHQYYESPLYCKENSKSICGRRKSVKALFLRLVTIPYCNAFALLLPVLVYHAWYYPQLKLEYFLWIWIVLTYIWAFSTTLFPYLKALGAGAYYVYHAFFPLFLLMGLSIQIMPTYLQRWVFVLWIIGLIFSIIEWERYCRSIPNRKTTSIGEDLMEVLDYLKKMPKDGVFCIPFQLPDGTAFWTRKKVFWGGHSFGFHTLLKPYFPIMREEVTQVMKKWPLNYLLFWKGYLKSLKDIGLEEGRDIRFLFGKGDYGLYEIIK